MENREGNVSLEGFVDDIIYHNEDNGYAVFEIVSGGKHYTCTGIVPMLSEGEYVSLSGTVVIHPEYGEQIKVAECTATAPADEISMERYLGSGAIKGVGEALARRIVKQFGADTFRVIEEEPELLARVKGISEKKAYEIANQMVEKRDLRRVMIYLQDLGISPNMALKIYGQYGPNIYRIIEENPYRLAEDVSGIGFKIADQIAAKAGILADSDFRIRSGMMYILGQATQAGHVFLPKEELFQYTRELLGLGDLSLEEILMDLSIDHKVVIKDYVGQQIVYATMYYHMEQRVASRLDELDITYEVDEGEVSRVIRQIEKERKMELEEMQLLAVKEAAEHGLFVLTGGPGTGKTTTINAIIRYFEMEGMEIRLAAPTGRAAKRMKETTGYEAQTIHRLLELSGVPEGNGNTNTNVNVAFERNEDNPLECDVVIIDEMSMVDLMIMNSLLKAIPVGCRLILVGDENQLPSVGPGNVLKDIIASETFSVVRLTKIFRQASESEIIMNAHTINRGEHVELNKNSKDFLFIHRENANTIMNAMIPLLKDKLPAYVHADVMDIQVITPMRKGPVGVENLNTVLQQYLNPPAPSKNEKNLGGGVIFREGDKVMQIRNNYQLEWEVFSRHGVCKDSGTGVFNGDIGTIRKVSDYAEEVTVEYEEGKQVRYSYKQLEELELAYAITIHKSQGSEYPAVVIPMLGGPRMLMTKNLLYTAVTRAKQCVCLVGLESVFQGMIANCDEARRYSTLGERIVEVHRGLPLG
ncbi:MAG: ATP-dependent RecD-like DNA helicase [Lachnospiraceae bacterium]|nr:ATP-dependent RecD-like DNA helicase [Lachnospiraceae bacterium]